MIFDEIAKSQHQFNVEASSHSRWPRWSESGELGGVRSETGFDLLLCIGSGASGEKRTGFHFPYTHTHTLTHTNT